MKVFLIAEAGCNWQNFDQARALVKAVGYTGAQAVKFQSFGPDFDPKLKQWSLSEDEHFLLQARCEDHGILFLTTCFDEYSFKIVEQMSLRYGKIPSGELTNVKYLDRISNMFDHLFVSTGMASLTDVEKALVYLGWPKRKDFTIMHCVSGYPPNIEDVNLKAIETLTYAFKLPVGLSDHTRSITLPAAAVAMGVVAIEKHIKLDETAIDKDVSLTVLEFTEMVDNILEIEDALGDGIKRCQESEKETLTKKWRYK